jgi:hypothetical protein
LASRNVVRCTRERVPEVAELLAGPSWRAGPGEPARLHADLAATYFDHPWADPALPPLACEDGRGRLEGFLGVVPCPALLDGRPVRAAVSSNLRVRADAGGRRDPTTALRLLGTFLKGPQDLSFADAANDRAKRLWVACGGTAAPLYSLDWLLPLRPSGPLLALQAARPGARPRRLLRSAGRALDLAGSAAWRRLLPLPPAGALGVAPFDPAAAAAILGRVPGARLRAAQDAASLAWVAGMAGRKALAGACRSLMATDGRGGAVGWFTYLQQRPGVGDVLDLVAADRRVGPVLDLLIRDAAGRGVSLLRGVADAWDLQAYRDRLCLLSAGRWTLVHARDPALVRAFRQGEAFLQGSEGERWMLEFPGSL